MIRQTLLTPCTDHDAVLLLLTDKARYRVPYGYSVSCACSMFARCDILIPPSAVKFIRDQAQVALTEFQHEADKHKGAAASAQAAANAVKKLLVGDGGTSPSVDFVPQTVSKLPAFVDPLHGWAEGVSPRKGHFCLLLKPQIVLRANADTESVCVLAAVQGKLNTFSIMDNANIHDPISGKIMNRCDPIAKLL